MSDSDPIQEPIGQAASVPADIWPFFTWPVDYRPTKVVSLVPSITDSLIHLGLGDTLIGITTYCPEPQKIHSIKRVGGPASLEIEAIVSLSPDLVIAGLEENSPNELLKLSEAGIPLWIVFPRSVFETIAFLYQIAEGFRSQQAFQQIHTLEVSITYLRSSKQAYSPENRYFCPIWHEKTNCKDKEFWMVFDNQTYAADILSLFGAENCFGSRERQAYEKQVSALEGNFTQGDVRYYKVSSENVIGANPSLILLPSEPYPFDHCYISYMKQVFSEVTAIEKRRIKLLDGKLIFWYGTRLGQALQVLPSYFLNNE